MSPRFAPVLVLSLAVLSVAACAGAPAIPITTGVPPTPTFAPVVVSPEPTPIPVATADPSPGDPDADPGTGDVEGSPGGPGLTIVPVDAITIQATIDDLAAKAWRLEIHGTGDRAKDAWLITVETGDVGPLITATEVVDGRIVDEMDLSGYTDGTAAAGGCHSTLPVCMDSDGFRLPDDGDGSFSARLHLSDPTTPLMVVGAAASWAGEPFILGPWQETDAFPWGATS